MKVSEKIYFIVKNKTLKQSFSEKHNREFQYLKLAERHELLKELQDKAGKGGSYSAVNEEDMD